MRSGKGSKRRVVPLNKDARAALALLGHEENQGSDRPIMSGSGADGQARSSEYS